MNWNVRGKDFQYFCDQMELRKKNAIFWRGKIQWAGTTTWVQSLNILPEKSEKKPHNSDCINLYEMVLLLLTPGAQQQDAYYCLILDI